VSALCTTARGPFNLAAPTALHYKDFEKTLGARSPLRARTLRDRIVSPMRGGTISRRQLL